MNNSKRLERENFEQEVQLQRYCDRTDCLHRMKSIFQVMDIDNIITMNKKNESLCILFLDRRQRFHSLSLYRKKAQSFLCFIFMFFIE